MSEAVWLILAAMLCVLGMTWLAAAMRVHWRQLYPNSKNEPKIKLLRSLATLIFIMAAVCCFRADHVSMAVLVWVMLSTVSAFIVSMIFSYAPYALRPVCPKFFENKTV